MKVWVMVIDSPYGVHEVKVADNVIKAIALGLRGLSKEFGPEAEFNVVENYINEGQTGIFCKRAPEDFFPDDPIARVVEIEVES